VPQIEGGRWDGIARKLFDISAPSAIPALADEIIPTFEIQNWEPELYVLRRERILSGGTAIGPNAAQVSHVGLTNPINSQALVIVDSIEPAATVDAIWFLALSNEELSVALGWGQVAYGNRDLRWPGAGVPATTLSVARLVSLNSAVAQGVSIYTGTVLAASNSRPRPFPLVLPPNTGVLFRPSTINIQMRASFTWRERSFNPQERP